MPPRHRPRAPRQLIATASLIAAAILAAACQRSPATPSPAPAPTTAPAGEPSPLQLPADAPVRVKLAGGGDGWLHGRWVTTSAGCQGVLLDEAQLLARLATLTAVERAVSTDSGGEEWQPVPLAQIRDGEGCAEPSAL